MENAIRLALVSDMMTPILWADAEIIGVTLDYDAIVVSIRDSSGNVRRVRGEGYIGFDYSGHWDESIIATAQIRDDDDFAHTVWQSIQHRYSGSPPQTGSPARNSAAVWRTLEITLSDGATMRCVAASFSEA